MKVLVTGANGFIGKEIVTELTLNKLDVTELYGNQQFVNNELQNLTNADNIFYADISKYNNLKQLEQIKNVDAVIHSAGLAHQFSEIENKRFTEVNITGTKNVLDLALKLHTRHFILISSTAVYGIKNNASNSRHEIPVVDESAVCFPETVYAESKLEAERIAGEFCIKNNIALTILRLAPVIGESNKGNVARLIETIDKRRFIWIGDGQNLKSLLYKNDVARACIKVLNEKKNGVEIFNLAAEPIRMKEFVTFISQSLGKNIPAFKIPIFFTKIGFFINSKILKSTKINRLEKTFEKWLSEDVYSTKKIELTYNFQTATTIQKGIEKQVGHYLKTK
jgi:nucleoside-diphosphate-sugar epimerase